MAGSARKASGESRPFPRARACATLIATCAVVYATTAQAQEDQATRRMLIERATAERAAGHHGEALALAQRAGAVQMTPSVMLFIAQELATTGDPAGALGLADRCVREVERDRTVPYRVAILAACRALVTSSRSQVGYLVLRAAEPLPEGLRVTVRGVPLNLALLGVPNVVSPGDVAIEAHAPGRETFAEAPRVEVGATVEVTLELQPVIVPPPPVPAPPVVAAPVVPAPATPARIVPPPRRPDRFVPGLLLGAGAATLAGGVALLVLRDIALAGCTVNGGEAVCVSDEARIAGENANGYAIGAGVLLGVGAVAVGTALVWLRLARAEPASRAPLRAGLAPTPGGWSVAISGRLP